MTDTNPLPPLPEPEGVIVVGTQALRAFTAYQMRAYALQARAQVQGEQPDSPWTENVAVKLEPSRTGRVYIAGPMTGIAEFNFPAFNKEAVRLRAEGLTVLNPADHGIVEGAEWADYLRHDIAGLATCQRIHLLPGWEKSKGSRLEVTIAQALGMAITLSDGAASPDSTATQAEVTPEEVMRAAKESTAPEWQYVVDGWRMGLDLMKFTSLILALRPVQVPMTDKEPVAWISKTGHGTYFRQSITPELASLEHGGRKMWRPLTYADTHPAPGVPEFSRIAKRKLDELQEQGFAITGYAIQRGTERGFITDGGFVGWWRSDEAPGVQGVPDDVVRDAERYRWILCNYLKFHLPDEAWKHGSLDAAIDAAMLTATQAQKGQP